MAEDDRWSQRIDHPVLGALYYLDVVESDGEYHLTLFDLVNEKVLDQNTFEISLTSAG